MRGAVVFVAPIPAESSKEIGTRYRAFVEACQGGPISAEAAGPSIAGASELTDDAKEEAQEIRRLLLKLRRNTASFARMPAVGGASGAEHSKAQLEKVWNDMRLGHKYTRKKEDVRAFVFSADVFPPNIAKHGPSASLSEPIAADTERMKRVLEFIIQKRHKNDLILLYDGRSRACRKVMEEVEERLAASGAHFLT